jgi:hypothetical protein
MAGRSERWERDRFTSERDRDRYGDERRERYEERDIYARGGAGPGPGPRGPPVREHSEERFDRRYRASDDDFVRDRRYYEDDRFGPGPRRNGPRGGDDYDRRVVFEKEKEREVVRESSPVRARPTLLRRQSSLDTFDRRPLPRFYEREEYGPPARIVRDDYRAPAYVPIPLPRTRALPPPRRFAERESYDEIRIADPDYYGDEEFRPMPERVRETEVVRTSRRRNRSRDSRTTYSRRSSRSSSVTSRSSSSSGGTAVRSEYPKKGKTRIPGRLVSKRALIDLGYPFTEEVSLMDPMDDMVGWELRWLTKFYRAIL